MGEGFVSVRRGLALKAESEETHRDEREQGKTQQIGQCPIVALADAGMIRTGECLGRNVAVVTGAQEMAESRHWRRWPPQT